jgi:hypothetical protein
MNGAVWKYIKKILGLSVACLLLTVVKAPAQVEAEVVINLPHSSGVKRWLLVRAESLSSREVMMEA